MKTTLAMFFHKSSSCPLSGGKNRIRSSLQPIFDTPCYHGSSFKGGRFCFGFRLALVSSHVILVLPIGGVTEDSVLCFTGRRVTYNVDVQS